MKAHHKKRLVYIISNIEKSLAFEWVLTELNKQYLLTCILLNPGHSQLESFLSTQAINCIRISYNGKRDVPASFLKVLRYFVFNRPNIVHAHLFEAQLISLTAAWVAGVKQRIYTRHNSNYHQKYFPAAVKYDLLSNKLATSIISISQATDQTLLQLEYADPDKVVKIPHGFELDHFINVSPQRIDLIVQKWCIPTNGLIIGVIARQIEWKGIQYIIPAFKKYLAHYPQAHLVMANASGPFHSDIIKLLTEIPLKNYTLIGFEEDVAALYHIFDLYIHTPVDEICEAFGQTYVEALAAGIPSIFTASGIAAEFIQDKKNACLAQFRDPESIFDNLIWLSENPVLAQQIADHGRTDVLVKFGLTGMLKKLANLYDNG